MTSPAPTERHDHTAHLRAVHDQTLAMVDEHHAHGRRLAALQRIERLFEQAKATDSAIAAAHEQTELERIETQIALHQARARLATLTGVHVVDNPVHCPVDRSAPEVEDDVDEQGRRVLDNDSMLAELTDRLRRGEPLSPGRLLREYRAGTPRMTRLIAEAEAIVAGERR